ncbi:MAG: hypothetical protein FWG47_05525 [Propionibacteriaceae bacterium]|nr:hypothetical protein [Propionibacteriaceae bacterium]
MRYMSMLGKLLSVGVGVSYLVSAVVNTMAFFGFPNVMAGRITSFLLVAAWLGLAFYMGWFQRRKFVRFTLIFWVAAAVLVAGVTVISDLVLPIEFGNIFGSIHTVVLMLFAAPIFGFQLPIDSMYYFVVVMLLIAVLSLVSYKIGRIAKERNAAACSCSRD